MPAPHTSRHAGARADLRTVHSFTHAHAVCILMAAAIQRMIPSEPVTCVGIDLGTTFSCVAVFEDGEINVINNRAGKSITASVLFIPDSNASDIVVGDSARHAAAHAAGTLVYDAKRFIGKRYDANVVAREARGLPFNIVPVRLIPNVFVSTRPVLSRPVSSRLVSRDIQFCLVPSRPIPSCLVPTRLIPSRSKTLLTIHPLRRL